MSHIYCLLNGSKKRGRLREKEGREKIERKIPYGSFLTNKAAAIMFLYRLSC